MDKVKTKLRIKSELGRALLGEFMGTMVLVLIIGCVVAQSVLPRPALNSTIGINLGVGLGIAFGIAICARVSGGHINPAVSLMFLTFRQLTPLRFILYTLVQTAGAFVGAALAYLVYSDAINAFDGGARQVYGTKATAGIFASYSQPHVGAFNGLLDQIIATAIFCMFIAHVTDKRNRYPAWVQPLVIGTVFVMIGTAFAYNAGYPCNPARDFGPRLFTLIIGYGWEVFSFKDYGWFWIPIIGPFFGAVLGGWLYQLTVGIHDPTSPLEVHDEYRIVDVGDGGATTTTTHELRTLTVTKE
jgi:MIP family channel proteins